MTVLMALLSNTGDLERR